MGFIYKITNIDNNKVYIGQTTLTLGKRWLCHKSAALYNKRYLEGDAAAPRNKRGTCSKLYRAMNKYGHDKFVFEPIEELDNDDLNIVESQYIEEYNSVIDGYNLKSGGDSSCHSDETKQLLKTINARNMQTTFVKFRKYELLNDLPIHCIYIKKPKTEGVAVNKHPLCYRKEFTISKYKTMENAKNALLEFLADLELTGVKYVTPEKKGDDLPKGIRKIRNNYFVDKTIKGVNYRKYFSGPVEEENKNNALAYLNTLNN